MSIPSRHLLAGLAAGSLLALLAATPTPAAAGDSPWYVVAKAGQASVDEAFGPPVLGWFVDDEETSWGLELGYTVNPHLALQAGYRDYGSYSALPRPCPPGQVCPLTAETEILLPVAPRSADFTALSFAAVPRWPLTDRFALQAKLGLLAWDTQVERLFPGQSVDAPNDTSLLLGLGAHYELPAGLGLLLEAETSDLATDLGVGVSWRF